MTKVTSKSTGMRTIFALICILVFCCIGASVTGGHVSHFERSVFVTINSLPAFLMPLMTIVQYAGLLFAPVLAAIVLAAYKKYLAAVLVLLIIPAKLQIEHVVKSEFLRERPKVYIDDAILRGDVQASGLSFASGHAMIIFAIATFMTPFVPKVVRIVVWTIAVLCIIARVYLGAHLPLDVLGGALLGVALGLLLLVLHRCIGRLLHKKK